MHFVSFSIDALGIVPEESMIDRGLAHGKPKVKVFFLAAVVLATVATTMAAGPEFAVNRFGG